MDKINALHDKILEMVAEYYRLAHAPVQHKTFVPGESRVNYAGRVFDEKEMVNLTDAALEFWLTGGRYTAEFEKKLAAYLGVRFALMVNSGSSANLLAFAALTSPLLGDRRIKRGDEVITVACAFPTTIAPIIQYGAIPVFADVTLPGANIDVTQLEKAYSPKTKAVMIAHTLGNPFDVKKVKEFCDKHGLFLVEDNCDALGSEFEGRFTGTWGDIGTSSFYPPHHLTMGEGGAVYTDDPLLKKIMLSMRDWGRECWCSSGVDNSCGCRFSKQFGLLPVGYDHKYVYSHFGYNLKGTDLQAAIGVAQLDKVADFTAKRRENYAVLYEGLKDLEALEIFTALPEASPSWFGFLMTLTEKAKFTRTELTEYLEKNLIQTRNLFAGNILRPPCFETLKEEVDYRVCGDLSVTEKIMNNSFWIGLYPGMTEEKLEYMIAIIREFCGK